VLDCQHVELVVLRSVAAALDRDAHAIVDQRCPANGPDACAPQLAPRVFPDAIVTRTADKEIAFLEGVSERERLAEIHC